MGGGGSGTRAPWEIPPPPSPPGTNQRPGCVLVACVGQLCCPPSKLRGSHRTPLPSLPETPRLSEVRSCPSNFPSRLQQASPIMQKKRGKNKIWPLFVFPHFPLGEKKATAFATRKLHGHFFFAASTAEIRAHIFPLATSVPVLPTGHFQCLFRKNWHFLRHGAFSFVNKNTI